MTANADAARLISSALELERDPIAVSFHAQPPPGTERFAGAVPAGCVFWEHAAARTFATVTADHALCSIGVHTHALTGAPASQAGELQDTLAAMMGLDYVRESEVAALPVMPREHGCVLYGPLHAHPVPPDAVLVLCNARQGLVLAEAIQRVDGAAPPAMGRPACALVPQVIRAGAGAASLGCCGARAYLDSFTDALSLWGLPGARLAEYAGALDTLAKANVTLTAFHERRGRDVAAGERPTVRESLARLAP